MTFALFTDVSNAQAQGDSQPDKGKQSSVQRQEEEEGRLDSITKDEMLQPLGNVIPPSCFQLACRA